VLTILFLAPLLAFSQKEIKLKKKYFGKYKGTVSSYKVDTGNEVMQVGESAIYVNLAKEQISVTVGKNKMYGTYDVMFEAKKYFLLDATIEGQLATERIMVYKRGKKIARDGMYPQPVTELKKYK
jgi:hypothetical protein